MTKNLIALIGVSILISGCAVPSIGNRPTADFYPSEGLEKPIHSQKGRVETVTVEIAKEHERTGAINLDDWIGAQFIFENVSGKWADILIGGFKDEVQF